MRIRERMMTLVLIAMLMVSTLAIAMPVSAKEYYSSTWDIDVNSTPLNLTLSVVEDKTWVTWTFDFPVENFTGSGNLNVGLIIALKGEGEGPAFQIHNNDGTDSGFAFGTWLMSPWGPTISDGWNGWHSSDTNTLVTDLDWVQASGNRTAPHGDGILTIRILRTKLEGGVHWAASPTVGAGFYSPMYDVSMQVPTAFNWATPLVDTATPNYEFIDIPVPPLPNRRGIVVFDNIRMQDMWRTPHKLIVVELPYSPESYTVNVTVRTEYGLIVYARVFQVRPVYAYIALYLHENVFPDNYEVVITSDLGPLPYLVASREGGIERTG